MMLSRIVSGYEAFARQLATKAAAQTDTLISGRRHVRIEQSDFVLGAEAIPAPLFATMRGSRR